MKQGRAKTLEERIAELLARAEPLRKLFDDDPAKAPLTQIVDTINHLRALQAAAGNAAGAAQALHDEASFARLEGDDAA